MSFLKDFCLLANSLILVQFVDILNLGLGLLTKIERFKWGSIFKWGPCPTQGPHLKILPHLEIG
jgi:hypothetical protein